MTDHAAAAGQPSATPSGASPKKSSGGLIAAVIAGVVVLALVGFLAVRFIGGQDSTAGPGAEPGPPSVSGWDETSTPSPSPTPDESEPPDDPAALQPCPDGDPGLKGDSVADDRIHGGGLSFEPLPSWRPYTAYGLSWAYDVSGQSSTIAPDWIAIVQVGALRIGDGWINPRQSAEKMMQCLTTSSYYPDLIERKNVLSKAVTINGQNGWRIKTFVSVDRPDGITGDIVNIVVLDTGNENAFGFYTDSATPDTQSVKDTEDTIKTLRVG